MAIATKKLYYRQKVLLALIQEFGGELTKIDLQKYLFLYTNICQETKSYEFVPFKFGCFSFQSYADRNKLLEFGNLSNVENWKLSDKTDYVGSLQTEDRNKIRKFVPEYKHLSGNDLIKYVYKRYPYYAINSEIAVDLLNDSEITEIDKARPNKQSNIFFTIGYEGISFENYLNKLIQNNIKLLIDVRKNPLSRKFGFSKKILSETLQKLNIDYKHYPELGIVSEKRTELKTLEDYKVLFDQYENTTLKSQSEKLNDLKSLLIENGRVAITCFESDVCMCHRGRVASALQKLPEWNFRISHI